MSDRELMENISDSYEDFVDSMVRWMSRDCNIRTKVLDYLKTNSNPSSSDILGVLWDCLGIGGEPIEIVDEAKYEYANSSGVRAIV